MTSDEPLFLPGVSRGSPCHEEENCLPQLQCLNFTCSCPLPCFTPPPLGCPCPLLSSASRAYWPSLVVAAILVFAAFTTLLTCAAHSIARRFSKPVPRQPQPLPEISTLGNTYGTDTLYCEPTPSGTPSTTPWNTPLPAPRFNFFHRKGSCPNPMLRCPQFSSDKNKRGSMQYSPLFFKAALPVVSCALAAVQKRPSNTESLPDDAANTIQFLQNSVDGKINRSTCYGMPCGNSEASLIAKPFCSIDICSADIHLNDNNNAKSPLSSFRDYSPDEGMRKRVDREVPVSLDVDLISSPQLTSISSNDTFLTANTSTPQENSKYSFHSVMDSSLESYLTLSLSSPNPTPPSLSLVGVSSPVESPQRPSYTNHLPKSILKKDMYGQAESPSISPVHSSEAVFALPGSKFTLPMEKEFGKNPLRKSEEFSNGFLKTSVLETRIIDPADMVRLEHVKKLISEKIVNSLANGPNGFVSNYSYYDSNDSNNNLNRLSRSSPDDMTKCDVLETHL